MACTWLLTIALAAASTASQELPQPQPQTAPATTRAQTVKNPYARLFQGGQEASPKPAPAPFLQAIPGDRPYRAIEGTEGKLLRGESVEVICGLTVVKKSPQIDSGIALQANRGAGIAVRRIEPVACGAGQR
jgi:hypothetical protein